MVGRSNTQVAIEKLVARFGREIIWLALPIAWWLLILVTMSPLYFIFGGAQAAKSFALKISLICIPAAIGGLFGSYAFYSSKLPHTKRFLLCWFVFGVVGGLAAIILEGLTSPRRLDGSDFVFFLSLWTFVGLMLGWVFSRMFKGNDT